MWISRKATSKFNILRITPTWNASTWSSKWGQLVWTTFLDCHRQLRPGTATWLSYKGHSRHTEVMKISKLWHGFKVSPILADLCHMWTAPYGQCLHSISERISKMHILPSSKVTASSNSQWPVECVLTRVSNKSINPKKQCINFVIINIIKIKKILHTEDTESLERCAY